MPITIKQKIKIEVIEYRGKNTCVCDTDKRSILLLLMLKVKTHFKAVNFVKCVVFFVETLVSPVS